MPDGFEGSDLLISRVYTLAKKEGHHVLIRGNTGAGFADAAFTTEGWVKVAIQSGDTENATVNIAGSVTLNALVDVVSSVTLNAHVGLADSTRATPSNINTTYDDSTVTATSAAIDVDGYRMGTLGFDLAKNGAPTDFQIEVLESVDDSTSFPKLMNGPLGSWFYDDAAVGASGRSIALTFPVCGDAIKIKTTATGTNLTLNFSMDNASLKLRT